MHSTAFWCLFVVLLFFGLYCVTTVTPFIERSKVLRYLACADLSNIFPVYSSYKVSYIFNGRLQRDTGASPMLCKLHYNLPSQREFGPPVV